MLRIALLIAASVSFGASIDTESSVLDEALAHKAPCDYDCCPCAKNSFDFTGTSGGRHHRGQSQNSPSCMSCYDWVDYWMAPEYKDYCSTRSCYKADQSYYPYDYSVIPRDFYKPYDYPKTYYHGDGSVVRHIPGVGNETLPPNWGTSFYGNGYCGRSYFYPRYSVGRTYQHHRRSNSTSKQEAAKSEVIEQMAIQASEGLHVPTLYKIEKKFHASPCDFSCCSDLPKMFYFAPVQTATCKPCEDFVSAHILPKYKSSCKANALKAYYTDIQSAYIRAEYDYPQDHILTDGSVIRHVPSMGDIRYPVHWPTPYKVGTAYYSNYMNGHYYYPSYSYAYYNSPMIKGKRWTPETASWFFGEA